MKLSNSAKETVIKLAVDKVFKSKIEAATVALGESVLTAILKNGGKLASEIPEGFESFIRVQSSWSIYHPQRQNPCGTLRLPVCAYSTGGYSLDSDEGQKLPEFKALDKIMSERDAFLVEVKAVVNSCTTDKQLADTAPELAALLPQPPENVSGVLVAVETVNRVRTAIGSVK